MVADQESREKFGAIFASGVARPLPENPNYLDSLFV
jgi:hypothetical protein